MGISAATRLSAPAEVNGPADSAEPLVAKADGHEFKLPRGGPVALIQHLHDQGNREAMHGGGECLPRWRAVPATRRNRRVARAATNRSF